MVDDVGNILGASQRARLLALQKTARQLDGVSLRLATGQKVSSALDNPNSFFLSRALRSRAEDLTRLLDGIGQSIKAIQVADHGIKAELSILDQAESYLQDLIDRFNAGELDTAPGLATNERLVTFASAADLTTYVVGQDVPASGTITTSGGNEVTFSGNFWRRKAFNYTITPDTVLVFEFRSPVIPEIATIGFDNDQNFGNDNNRFWIYGTQTSGITYAAPFPTYDYTDIGNWEEIEIPVGLFFTGSFSYINFVADDDTASLPLGITSYRNIVLREGPKQTAEDNLAKYSDAYAKIINQLDGIAIDANYRGINLLKGEEMTTYFNETRTSKLVSKGIDATYAGLGLNPNNFNSISSVQAELDQVREARNKLRGFARTLAVDLNVIQIRQDFTQSTINTHKAGASDLTDADLNEEGANFLALQTMQQLGVAMMAMSRNNSVLSLFA